VKKPNFFIVGAPKCGTTALCEYLKDHPQVLFSEPKEPKFFNTDFHESHRYALTMKQYLRCFKEDMNEYTAVGEGSVWYLCSGVAIKNVLEFNPEARFIVLIRCPVELAYSLHSQLFYGGDEDVEDFKTAWDLQASRREGKNLPRHCRDPKALQYGEIAKLGEQIERLYAVVPKDRVLIISSEDLWRDTASIYRDVLSFLELSDDKRSDFPRMNENRRITSRLLPRILYLAGAAKRALGIRGSTGVWRALTPVFTERKKRRPMSPELKQQLRLYFREDVEKLAGLIGRDLSHW